MILETSPAESEPTRRCHLRYWQLTGETALEDMVLGVDERTFVDGDNVLSSDDFYACLAIVVCRMAPIFYAHLSKVAGLCKGGAIGIWDRSRGSDVPEGTAYEIKPVTRIHRVPEALIGPDSPEGIAVFHQVANTHYLLDMG